MFASIWFPPQSIPELGYVEQKKTLMEKVLDFEFHDPTDRSIFYASKSYTCIPLLLYELSGMAAFSLGWL